MTEYVSTVPRRPAGPMRVVDQLNAEWHELSASRAGAAELAAGLARASQGCDVTLHALLADAHRGNALAARTVLQSMLGRLVRMAARDRRSTPVDDFVSAAWCVIATYPLVARPRRIAANLALDTLKAVQREHRWWGRAYEPPALPGDALETAVDRWSTALARARPELDDAARVIQAGLELRLIDRSAGELLRSVYVTGLSGVETAAQLGSTPGSVRVRCSRAVRQLADRAVDLVEAA